MNDGAAPLPSPDNTLSNWWGEILRARLGRGKAYSPPSLIASVTREMRGAFMTITGHSLSRANALALLLSHVLPEQHAMARRAFADGWPEEAAATPARSPLQVRNTSMNEMSRRSSDEDGRRLTAASEARERLNSPHIRNVINNNSRSYSDRTKVLVDIAWPATEPRALVSQEDVTSIALRHLQGVPFDWVRQMTEAIAAEFARREAKRLAQLEAERLAQQPEVPAPQPDPLSCTGEIPPPLTADERAELTRDARSGADADPVAQYGDEPSIDAPLVSEHVIRIHGLFKEDEPSASPDVPASDAPQADGGEAGIAAQAPAEGIGEDKTTADVDGDVLTEPMQLHAISPEEDGRIETRCFTSKSACAAWVHRWNGKRNLYHTVNPRREAMSKKRKKQDISHLKWLHVDLDRKEGESAEDCVRRSLAALDSLGVPPSCIVHSGNGLNVYWHLAVPVPIEGESDAERIANAERLEAYSKAIGDALGADHCFNIDRILRLPNTINLPTKAKRAKGYVVCEAKLLHRDETLTYKLEDFAHLLPKADSGIQEKKAEAGVGVKEEPGAQHEEAVHLDSLDDIEALRSEDERTVKLRKLIETADLALRLDPERASEPYKSRSEAVFAVIRKLLAFGVSASVIKDIFLNARWRIGDRAREEPNPRAFIGNEIARA